MKFKKHPILILLVAVISAAIIAVTIFIVFFLDAFVKTQITREVYKSSQSLYILKIENLHTRFWSGTVYMKKVLLYQNATKLKTLKSEKPNENISTVKLYMPSLQIHHIRWINYLISNDLKVGKIFIKLPEIYINGSTFSENIQESNRKFIELLPGIIAGFAGSLKIKELSIESGKLKYNIETQKINILQTADHIYIDLNNIKIDTIPTKKILYSDNIQISLDNYQLKTSNELYSLRIDKISSKLSDSSFQFEKFHYFKVDTILKDNKQTEIFVNSIKGERVNFHNFLYNKKMLIGNLLLEAPDISSIIHQKHDKKDTSSNQKVSSKNAFFVSPFVSDIISSFTINNIEIQNGTVQNKIYTNNDSIFQEADHVNIHIVKVAGEILDSLKLKQPDHIDISLSNYKLNLNNPETKITILKIKASSYDSTISLLNPGLYYKNERSKNKKIFLNNTAEYVLATGFDLQALITNDKINFKKITINGPRTDFRITRNKKSPTKDNSLGSNFGQIIQSMNVDRIEFDNGSFIFQSITKGDTIIHQSKSYRLTVEGISATNDKILTKLSYISAELKEYELKLLKEKIFVTADLCSMSSKISSVLIKNLKIIQNENYSDIDTAFNSSIPEVNIDQIDLTRALLKSEFAAGTIRINNMIMNIFLNEGKTRKPDYAKRMPNEIARSIPFYFRVETVRIDNGLFTFKENKNSSAVFSLNKTKACIYNLTNDKKNMSAQNPARLVAKSMLLNQGRLFFQITTPLLTSKFNCTYSGKIGPMNAEAFNNTISTYADMKAETGQIDSGSFTVNISNGIANGNLKLIYHDFHIKIIDTHGKGKKAKSILGNFIIKNDNPQHKKKDPEIVSVSGERKPEDSIFSLLWRPIKEGVIKTVTKDTFVGD